LFLNIIQYLSAQAALWWFSFCLRLGYHTWLCEWPFAAVTQLLSMTCTSTRLCALALK
jgi:hypothetical protein